LQETQSIKPLYKLGKGFIAFASERKALWSIGIQDPKRLLPGTILINRKIIIKKITRENRDKNGIIIPPRKD